MNEEQLRAYLKDMFLMKKKRLIMKIWHECLKAYEDKIIKNFTEMVSRFDRLDFIELHSLCRLSMKTWSTYLGIKEGNVEIHMLAERRYPLIRKTLERMMELRLTVESEGEAVFDLLRFIQKQINEFEEQDGSEKDL
ncbi:hypothetical protein Tco_0628217 [Tanacetum coccineum]|uniref:Uncharacterized protein n=1 Tax=Tanacetum coccineum TaxID=301880 RepID=A0ABQ4WPL5_9ASTR